MIDLAKATTLGTTLKVAAAMAAFYPVVWGAAEVHGRGIGKNNEQERWRAAERDLKDAHAAELRDANQERDRLEGQVIVLSNQGERIIERVKEIPIEISPDCPVPYGAYRVLRDTARVPAGTTDTGADTVTEVPR